ncbi:MAG: Na/Pi cotransporter family protein [Bacteroidaceae bacterium]|nr:Na/Pi cotransporter family protein [Bacteroidaceae bacterium]
MSILVVFKLLGSLALLMFGMKSMSEALQKMAGPQLRHVLGAMTTNRFTGALTGMFVTAAVQSSTATTLMTVSFVNAGLLTLVQAISVIMGANIGTTLTAWIMSLGMGFNISDFVYPAFFLGIILIYMKKRRIVGDFLFGVAFLFLGLATLKETGFSLVDSPESKEAITAFFAEFSNGGFFVSVLFLLIGTVLTLCVQSSAAIMAITMMLCSTGVLHIEQGVMLVLGENVGTTITSNIVALSANTQARRAAFAHLSFNAVGVFWVLLLMQPFFAMVCHISGFDPAMNPNQPDFAIKASVALATFHSAFNISNTALLIWFIPQIEKFVCWVIKPKSPKEEEDFRLRFITSGIMKTPELSVLEAHKEISSFSVRIQRMFDMVHELLTEKDQNKFNKLFNRIEKYENIADNMEISIAEYLDQVSDAHLSDETKAKIRAMLREISEVESIGDSCYHMAQTINQKVQGKKEHFTEEQYEHLHAMMNLTDQALTQMNQLLSGRKDYFDVYKCYNTETEINNYRDQLKSQNIIDINNHKYTYGIGTIYMELINSCERLADYVVNVVEARTGTKMRL